MKDDPRFVECIKILAEDSNLNPREGSGMFDQEAEDRLKANSATAGFFKDPDFRKRFAMIRRNPHLLGDLL